MPDKELAANFRPAIEQPFAETSEPEPEEAGQADDAEAAKPEDEPVDDNAPAEGEQSGDPEPDEDQESEEDDLEEFEWDGKTIAGPKGLKEAVMKNADYTQKTQVVSKRNKELDEREQSLADREKVTEEEIEARAETWAIETAFKQYEGIDWQRWFREDPAEAQAARIQYDDLRTRLGEGKERLKEFANQRSQAAQQDFAKRVGQTREFAKEHIKGFSPDMEKRVVEFALEQGVSQAQLQANLNPVMFSILHKAMVGDQTLKNPAAPPRKQATPLKTVSSRSNAPVRKSLADMSMEEYAKARQAQGYKPPK